MRFFNGAQIVNYPDTKDELMLQILQHSIDGPQKTPLTFFQIYFQNGGGRQHPILGDLEEIMIEINLSWDQESNGLNLVSSLIEHKLCELVSIGHVIS